MIQLMSQEELSQYPVARFAPPAILPPEPERSHAGQAACAGCEPYRPEPQRSGNLQVDPEIHLPSPGIDVDIAYYYNAASTVNGPIGYGRQLSTNLTLDMHITSAGATFDYAGTLVRANGALARFSRRFRLRYGRLAAD
ncbi:MAG TPA: hypothetical protein VKT77_13075 [Chthonomonadaceae bacterium]|nr:hypothetical protein [Chthonomonadaceae bacterium]